jgi:hypothetical protein
MQFFLCAFCGKKKETTKNAQSSQSNPFLTSPCRFATSLSFRKERDVLAKAKQGEVSFCALCGKRRNHQECAKFAKPICENLFKLKATRRWCSCLVLNHIFIFCICFFDLRGFNLINADYEAINFRFLNLENACYANWRIHIWS